MAEATMLERAKAAMGITGTSFDDELTDLIAAAQIDLGIAGVVLPQALDAVCRTAVITYCRVHFGTPPDYDRLKQSYDEQKGQLSMATGYTNWGDAQ